jgi:membrane-associated protease RseP (regulator of RpoE activity)
MEWYELITFILVIYALVLYLGHFVGLWKRIGARLYGPVLLFRTKRGTDIISRLARRRRVWRPLTTAGAAVAVVAMAFMLLFLIWVTFTSPNLLGEEAPSESVGPGLPTESLAWTLFFGGMGMAVAVFIHELGHGVSAATYGLKLDSVGILLVVIPVGAFVEPNDADMAKAKPSTSAKIYAAGIMANLLVAAVCMALLVLAVAPSANVVEDGALVTGVTADSPGETLGVSLWSEIVEVGDETIVDVASLRDFRFDEPGSPISVTIRYGDERRSVLLPQGLVITEVLEGPAGNARLEPGMILQRLDGRAIHSTTELRSVVENASHEEPVPMTVLVPGQDPVLGDWFVEDHTIGFVNLTTKWLWYYTHYNYLNKEEYKDISFIGIEVAPFGLTVVEAEHLTDLYANPYSGSGGSGRVLDSTVRFVSLPIIGYSPLIPPATDLYEPSGLASVLPDGAFWTLVNVLYWIFWGNVILAFANALPLLPMDGGYLFRDVMRWLLVFPRSRLTGIEKITYQRRFMEPEEKLLVKWSTIAMSFLTLAIIAWLLIDPLI